MTTRNGILGIALLLGLQVQFGLASIRDFDALAYRGTIGDSLRVEMTLSRKGADLSGSYFYTNIGKNLRLQGKVDASRKFVLTEFDEKGKSTGTFKGVFDVIGGEMQGTWLSPDRSTKLPFYLVATGLLGAYLDRIPTEPRRVARTLRAIGTPTAKAYLAYLYFTAKVKVPNPKEEISRLIREALDDVHDERGDTYMVWEHAPFIYTSLADLLLDIRLISDADAYDEASAFFNLGASPPSWVFREHPRESFWAFRALYGNRRDLPGDLFNDYTSIEKLDGITRLSSLVNEIQEKLFITCDGSERFSIERVWHFDDMATSMVPRFLLEKEQELRDQHRIQMQFLEIWSNATAWNKDRYTLLTAEIPIATKTIRSHYRGAFGMNKNEADRASPLAVTTIFMRMFESIEVGNTDDWQRLDAFNTRVSKDPIYRAFTNPGLDVTRTTELIASPGFLETKMATNEQAKEYPPIGDWMAREALGYGPLDRALKYAVLNGLSLEIIRLLVGQGARSDVGQESALMLAVKRPDVIRLLLESGANPNYQNAFGKTALHYAAELAQFDAVGILLKHGASVNQALKDFMTVRTESGEKDLPINYCAIAGKERPEAKFTPLMYAARDGTFEVIELLLRNGADIAAKNEDGRQAVDLIAFNSRLLKTDQERAKRLLAVKN
jgi:ankyrin repeat protein